MADNYLNLIAQALATPTQQPAGIGSKFPAGLFGLPQSTVADALRRSRDRKLQEESSARLATLASRALQDPGSLTFAEIRSLAGSVLTQAPNHLK